MYDYMDDCIHLKACRRCQKISKSKGFQFARSCTENCTAYVSGEINILTEDLALETAWRQYDGRRDPYDVYAHGDFNTITLNEFIEDLEE